MNYTPRQIVAELDKYIVGQQEAKKMVAIALRNRWRAKQLPENVREEYVPKNILLIGPTGVGKTELARRLAKLMKAPFIKVEATKYTEVGYVGRDVDQMIRDLVENSVRMVKEEMLAAQEEKAMELANQRLLSALPFMKSLKTVLWIAAKSKLKWKKHRKALPVCLPVVHRMNYPAISRT